VKVGILGASGYTGAELVRILLNHPAVDLKLLTASERNAGQSLSSVFPQFAYSPKAKSLPHLVTLEQLHESVWDELDCVFLALPHGTTQAVVKQLPPSLKVVDLSADFRLKVPETYQKWYGSPHQALDAQAEAVYGLPELHREEIRNARIVANPGCYPTPCQLTLVPLLRKGMIETEDIIIDAKSGTTGAGRAPKQGTLFCEVHDGMHAYGVAAHRHAPEIEQQLSLAAGLPMDEQQGVTVAFTPHLAPMSRGIFESIYFKLKPGVTAVQAKEALQTFYVDDPFVVVVDGHQIPETRHVRGTNTVAIQVQADRLKGRAIATAVMDNLCKGASGQAVQNFNLIFGLPETMALDSLMPLFP